MTKTLPDVALPLVFCSTCVCGGVTAVAAAASAMNVLCDPPSGTPPSFLKRDVRTGATSVSRTGENPAEQFQEMSDKLLGTCWSGVFGRRIRCVRRDVVFVHSGTVAAEEKRPVLSTAAATVTGWFLVNWKLVPVVRGAHVGLACRTKKTRRHGPRE